LVDGEDIPRQVIPISRLQLTNQVIKASRGCTSGKLRKLISKEGVAKKFAESSLGKSYAQQARRENLNDFERFNVIILRRRLSRLLRSKKARK
jgi:large subunit ribosomal protein L14e